MHIVTSLTVSESKRLIAKGLVQSAVVCEALAHGLVAVCPGTTNGYVIEELLGKTLDKTAYVTGRTLPAGYAGPACRKEAPDVVLRAGQPVETTLAKALEEMGPGDVFIKGANAINCDFNQAGVLIGHPTGGTMGAALGRIVARRIHLLHAVGLEKSVPGDLHDVAAAMKESDGKGPTLWVSPGEIFCEIEALATLAQVDVLPLAAGGVGGAEGAVWLMLRGQKKNLDRAQAILDDLRREPAFL